MTRMQRRAEQDWNALTDAQQRALIEGESPTAHAANALAARGLVRGVARYESALDLRRHTSWVETARGKRAREYGTAALCRMCVRQRERGDQ